MMLWISASSLLSFSCFSLTICRVFMWRPQRFVMMSERDTKTSRTGWSSCKCFRSEISLPLRKVCVWAKSLRLFTIHRLSQAFLICLPNQQSNCQQGRERFSTQHVVSNRGLSGETVQFRTDSSPSAGWNVASNREANAEIVCLCVSTCIEVRLQLMIIWFNPLTF